MEYIIRKQFYERKNKPKSIDESDLIIALTEDNWNDYGYETMYHLDVFKNGKFNQIGTLRILHKSEEKTRNVLLNNFEKLGKEFISIGTEATYYEKLIKVLGIDIAEQVLIDFNDISMIGLENNINFDLDHEGINNSLFRSSETRYLFKEVKNKFFLHKESKNADYNFIFKANYSDFEEDYQFTSIEIDFSAYNELPNRIFAIIGKNGVGKTRFLNQLSQALYDSSNPTNLGRFIMQGEDSIPAYQKVIAISYSIFDHFFKGEDNKFNKDKETKKSNYTYIGLHRLDNQVYSSEELIAINKEAYNKIEEKDRSQLFVQCINDSKIFPIKLDKSFDKTVFFENKYSSGQSIFLSMLCRLLGEINSNSLIFFDEPELYLHPNAIATLMKIFNHILGKFNSYAILCTHSPILVQEIPSRYVRNLIDIEGDVIQTKISIETFGANISEITKEVYNVTETESLYKSTLIEMSNKLTQGEVEQMFDNELSLKARMFLSEVFLRRT